MNIYINVFLVDIQLANGNAFFIFKKIGVIDIERGLVALDYFYGQAGELFSFYRIWKNFSGHRAKRWCAAEKSTAGKPTTA